METDSETNLMVQQAAGVTPGPSSSDEARAARLAAGGFGGSAAPGGSAGSPPPAGDDPGALSARQARLAAAGVADPAGAAYAVDADEATKARLRAAGMSDLEMVQQKRLAQGDKWAGKIKPEDRYVQEPGVVGHVLGALDYVANVARSGIKGLIDAKDQTYLDDDANFTTTAKDTELGALSYQGRLAWQYMKQAASKQRQTTATELKDTLTDAYLGKKVRFGQDDGKFQWGDVADVGLDLGVGILTDPLFALTEGVSSLSSGAGFLAKGAAEARVGLETPAAARYARLMAGGRAAVGGVLGAATADPDEIGMNGKKTPWYEIAGRAAAGAALGVAAPSIVGKVASSGRDLLDVGSDIYAGVTRGEEFLGAGSAKRVAGAARARQEGITRWIVQGRLGAMSDLVGPERDAFTGVMHDLKNASVDYRNERLQAMGYVQKAKNGQLAHMDSMEGFDRAFNKVTGEANDYVADQVMPKLLKDRFGQDPEMYSKMVDAVNRMADHNTNIIGRINSEKILATLPGQARRDMGKVLTGDSALGMPGLRFHVDDVYQFNRQGEAAAILQKIGDQEAKIQAAKSGRTAMAGAEAGLSADETYAVYAQRFSKHFLDQEELQAMELSGRYGQTPAKQSTVRAWEDYALRPFDAATNFMKAGMLYFSTSWLRTQLFDNLSKAFTEGGFGNLVKTGWNATGGAWSKMGTDLRALLRGDVGYRIAHPDLIEMLDHGVLHDGLSGALRSELVGDFLHRPADLVAEGGRAARLVEGAGAKYKATTEWLMNDAPGVSHVVKLMQGVGSYMEGAARVATYTGARDALVAAGVERATAMKSAAQLVERTFFNYSDVTAMEASVAKRLMPFYTFYSKNMPYWLQAIFDPARVGRVAGLDKVRQTIGMTPTKFDYKGMTPYVEDNAPRKLGKDDQGNKRYMVSPVDPRVEALKMVDPHHVLDTLQERGNSLIKVPLELLSGHDFFTGDKLYPSDSEKGRKYLFSRGFKWVAANEVIKKLERFVGAEAGNPLGVDVDRRGNPFATSDNLVRVDKLLQALFPQGAIEQIAGPVGKNIHGKETPGISASNRLFPMQQVAVSPGAERMQRLHKEKEMHRESDSPYGK